MWRTMETEDNKTMEPGLLEALADQKDDLKLDVGRIWLSEEDGLDEWDGDQKPKRVNHSIGFHLVL